MTTFTATQYYTNAKPATPTYLTDEGRPSLGWLMLQVNRQRYVEDASTWTLENLKEHYEILTKHPRVDSSGGRWANCVTNLKMGIDCYGTHESKARLEAHFYECYDLS